jgi:microcystin-dependent protein
MSDPYLGEIEIFAFDFPPRGWVLCAGQLLPVEQNKALFELVGTVFGGDGVTNFALPDLRGRTPIGQGTGLGLTPRPMASAPGQPNHLLSVDETPYHSHNVNTMGYGDGTANSNVPGDRMVLATANGIDSQGKPMALNPYVRNIQPTVAMASASVGTAGGEVHNNMMPYTAFTVCIALQGRVPDPPVADAATAAVS